jgi:hypothetical protein
MPPVSLQKAGVFRHTTLGTDFDIAQAKARQWNIKRDEYRGVNNCAKPALGLVIPMMVADLFRKYELSPRLTWYVLRTRQDYACFYRLIETTLTEDGLLFGNRKLSAVTRQIAYSIYEQYVLAHGRDSANKAMSACQAAFAYGMLKFEEITLNPFLRLQKFSPPPRRQRWTDEQLSAFIRKAEEMGYASVGLCALLCMELVQRPGDILSLKWGSYEERQKTWHIRQSKCGAVVRVQGQSVYEMFCAQPATRNDTCQRRNWWTFGLPDKNGKTLATAQFYWDGKANCDGGLGCLLTFKYAI